jgi:hypothetical protein
VLAIAILSRCARGSISNGWLHFRLDNPDEDAVLAGPLTHNYQPTYEHFPFKYVSVRLGLQIDQQQRFMLDRLNTSLTKPVKTKFSEEIADFLAIKPRDIRIVLITYGSS